MACSPPANNPPVRQPARAPAPAMDKEVEDDNPDWAAAEERRPSRELAAGMRRGCDGATKAARVALPPPMLPRELAGCGVVKAKADLVALDRVMTAAKAARRLWKFLRWAVMMVLCCGSTRFPRQWDSSRHGLSIFFICTTRS